MKFNVKKWERVFGKDQKYVDNWNDIGIQEVAFSGHGDSQIAKVGDISLHGVFGVSLTAEYLEIHGFSRKENNQLELSQVRCYPVKSRLV